MTKKNFRSIVILSYTAVIALSGVVSITGDVVGIPFVIQNMFAILGGVLFGGLQGGAATGIFLTLGTLGVPIFAGFTGGIDCLAGTSGGFLAGYFVATLIAGFYIGTPDSENPTPLKKIVIGLVIAYAALYLIGTIQFIRTREVEVSFQSIKTAFQICIIPYIPGDIIKILVSAILGKYLRPISAKFLFNSEIEPSSFIQ